MVSQPCLGRVRGPARDDVDAAAGLGVNEHGRADKLAAQREVVATRGTVTPGRGILRRTLSAVCRETVIPGVGSSRAEALPANSRATALTWAVNREMRYWHRSRTPET